MGDARGVPRAGTQAAGPPPPPPGSPADTKRDHRPANRRSGGHDVATPPPPRGLAAPPSGSGPRRLLGSRRQKIASSSPDWPLRSARTRGRLGDMAPAPHAHVKHPPSGPPIAPTPLPPTGPACRPEPDGAINSMPTALRHARLNPTCASSALSALFQIHHRLVERLHRRSRAARSGIDTLLLQRPVAEGREARQTRGIAQGRKARAR